MVPVKRPPGFWTDRFRKGGAVDPWKLQDLAADTRFMVRELVAGRFERTARPPPKF